MVKLVLAMSLPCQPRAARGQIQDVSAPAIYPSMRGTYCRNEIGTHWLILGSLAAILASLPFLLQLKSALNLPACLGHAFQVNVAQEKEPSRKSGCFRPFWRAGTPHGRRLCVRLGSGSTQISSTLSLSRCKKFFDRGEKKKR